jgi:hypothetical protein
VFAFYILHSFEPNVTVLRSRQSTFFLSFLYLFSCRSVRSFPDSTKDP